MDNPKTVSNVVLIKVHNIVLTIENTPTCTLSFSHIKCSSVCTDAPNICKQQTIGNDLKMTEIHIKNT